MDVRNKASPLVSGKHSKLHDKISRKKALLYEDDLPATVLEELTCEIQELMIRIQAEVAALS